MIRRDRNRKPFHLPLSSLLIFLGLGGLFFREAREHGCWWLAVLGLVLIAVVWLINEGERRYRQDSSGGRWRFVHYAWRSMQFGEGFLFGAEASLAFAFLSFFFGGVGLALSVMVIISLVCGLVGLRDSFHEYPGRPTIKTAGSADEDRPAAAPR